MSNSGIERLKAIRNRTDLKIRPSKYLKTKFFDIDGNEVDLDIRYYQIQGILHLVCMNRFVLGDEMGLGKTLQTIAALCYIWDKAPDTKTIVITTKSAAGQWVDEFEKFTNSVQTFLCKGTKKKREKVLEEWKDSEGPSVLVMGYATARQDITQLLEIDPGYVLVLDEATAVKNPKARVHKCVSFMAKKASRVWALTATLIENNLLEGWGIYEVVYPGLLGNRTWFMEQFCITQMQTLPGSRRKVPVIVGYRPDAPQSFRSHIDNHFLGRNKFEVAKELPALTRKRILCDMTRVQRDKYYDAINGLLEIVRDGEHQEVKTTKLTSLIYCQQIVDHPDLIGIEGKSGKLDELVDLLTEGDLSEGKVIVFSRFRRMIDIIMETLERNGIKATRITGSESEDQRSLNKKAFQDPKSDTRVVCITTAARQGVNLQAAKALVFYDTPWSAGDYLQIIGRMIRIGSSHQNVTAIHLVCRNSIDQRVMDVLGKKVKLVEEVLGQKIKDSDTGPSLSMDGDVNAIFELLCEDARKGQK